MGLRRTWTVAVALMAVALLPTDRALLMAPLPQTWTQAFPIGRPVPWVLGYRFDDQAFVNDHLGRRWSTRWVWEKYLLLNRFCSPTFFAHPEALPAGGAAGMAWRWQMAQELGEITHEQDLRQWEQTLGARTMTQASRLPSEQQLLFFEVVGLSRTEAQHTGPLFLSHSKPLGEEPLHQQVVAFAHAMDPRVPGRVAVVGPFSAPEPTLLADDNTPWMEERADGTGGDEVVPGFPGQEGDRQAASLVATQTLLSTLERHGVLGMRVPLGLLQQPDDLLRLADKIDRYGNALSMRTGMDSQAMGLRGRVFWNLGPSDRPMAVAHAQDLGDDLYAIHSPWASFSHEWFHALSALSADRLTRGHLLTNDDAFIMQAMMGMGASDDRRLAKAFVALKRSIEQDTPTRATWPVVLRQAKERTQAFILARWGSNVWDDLAMATPLNEQQAIHLSMAQTSSRYNAAVLASHRYWITHPAVRSFQSSWVSRRMLMDKMLDDAGWEGQGGGAVGYFSDPEEWLAAAFQGDMSAYTETNLRSTSLINVPLPIEVEQYRRHWTRFFGVMAPWWQRTVPVWAPDPSLIDGCQPSSSATCLSNVTTSGWRHGR